MADRAEDITELEALDQRVDELLADVEQTAERLDAAIPAPPGDDSVFAFESADEVLGTVSKQLERPEARNPTPLDPTARSDADLTADEALAAVAAEIAHHQPKDEATTSSDEPTRGSAADLSAPDFASVEDIIGKRDEPPAAAAGCALNATATPFQAASRSSTASPVPRAAFGATEDDAGLSAAEFSSPEAIGKLDEKLAATAAELSAHCSDIVDDQETEAAIKVEEAHAPAAPNAGAPMVPAVPTATPAPATASAPSSVPGPVPVAAVAPAPAAPVHPSLAVPAPVSAAKVAVEEKTRRDRMGLGDAAAATIRPLANFTTSLSPGTRQTIAYAAVVTLFQAACLWGFLTFKGPPGDIAPTSAPVILRQPGDPSTPGKELHAAPVKKVTTAKPKADVGAH